uniref:Uncharacterized protein n=1 Tax=Schistosoma japonicum TaxID=6182 RepID=C1LET6_SCHJA|nr:hypothetical protein [Schistosoma japonicum]
MVQISDIETYHLMKDKANSLNLFCILESIIGGLMLEQPNQPINYIKNCLIDMKHIKQNVNIHKELYTWPHHPLLNSCKSYTNNDYYKFCQNCFYYHIKLLQTKQQLYIENEYKNDDITHSVFSLTELNLKS